MSAKTPASHRFELYVAGVRRLRGSERTRGQRRSNPIGFPKEWRDALVSSEPDKFLLPRPSDLRYNWVLVRLAAIDESEMRELVLDAWQMVVPRRVAAEYERSL